MTTTPTSRPTTVEQPAYAYVDTETDGLDDDRQVWEFAIIHRTPTLNDPAGLDHEEVFHAFVDLELRPNSSPDSLRIGRFWDRHPLGRELTGKEPLEQPAVLAPSEVALRVHQLLAGATVIGVNPAFDAVALGNLLRAQALPDEPWNYHLEDLVAETVGYLRAELARQHTAPPPCMTADYCAYLERTLTRPWKSSDLAAALGVEPAPAEHQHEAYADARWAQRWHDRLTGLA